MIFTSRLRHGQEMGKVSVLVSTIIKVCSTYEGCPKRTIGTPLETFVLPIINTKYNPKMFGILIKAPSRASQFFKGVLGLFICLTKYVVTFSKVTFRGLSQNFGAIIMSG